MKKTLSVWALCAISGSLSSCALFERNPEGFEDTPAAARRLPPTDPGLGERLFQPDEQEKGDDLQAHQNNASWEAEVSRLNTKVAALETKLDVLSANVDRSQLRGSQPVIEAHAADPQATLAVPVEEGYANAPALVSAAPVRPTPAVDLPEDIGGAVAASDSAVEKDFRSSMQLFQAGKNLEAASRFALLAKKYPRHLLAAHSLYWAGEAAGRAQQWSIAIQNWEELERVYPRSAYVPEALAGLARAYQTQGDTNRAKSYRDQLARSFPKSPVTVNAQAPAAIPTAARPTAARTVTTEEAEEIPTYEEPATETPATGEGE